LFRWRGSYVPTRWIAPATSTPAAKIRDQQRIADALCAGRIDANAATVDQNVAAPVCLPLHCTAFHCYGEAARTP
jgi:hypothetical protein